MKFLTGGSSNDMMVSDPKIDGWYTSAMNATSVDQIKQIVHDENVYVVNQNYLEFQPGATVCFLPVSTLA